MQLRKKLVIGAAIVGTLGIGTAAFAFWTTTGSGSGTAVTGAPVGVTISGNLANTSKLYPGASFPVTLTLTNTNPFAVTLGPISGVVTVPGDNNDPDINDVCQISVVSNTQDTPIAAAGTNPGTASVTVNVTMFDDPVVPQGACTGRLVNIAYTAEAPLGAG